MKLCVNQLDPSSHFYKKQKKNGPGKSYGGSAFIELSWIKRETNQAPATFK